MKKLVIASKVVKKGKMRQKGVKINKKTLKSPENSEKRAKTRKNDVFS